MLKIETKANHKAKEYYRHLKICRKLYSWLYSQDALFILIMLFYKALFITTLLTENNVQSNTIIQELSIHGQKTSSNLLMQLRVNSYTFEICTLQKKSFEGRNQKNKINPPIIRILRRNMIIYPLQMCIFSPHTCATTRDVIHI